MAGITGWSSRDSSLIRNQQILNALSEDVARIEESAKLTQAENALVNDRIHSMKKKVTCLETLSKVTAAAVVVPTVIYVFRNVLSYWLTQRIN